MDKFIDKIVEFNRFLINEYGSALESITVDQSIIDRLQLESYKKYPMSFSLTIGPPAKVKTINVSGIEINVSKHSLIKEINDKISDLQAELKLIKGE